MLVWLAALRGQTNKYFVGKSACVMTTAVKPGILQEQVYGVHLPKLGCQLLPTLTHCNSCALVLMPQRLALRAASTLLHLLHAVTPCANLAIHCSALLLIMLSLCCA